MSLFSDLMSTSGVGLLFDTAAEPIELTPEEGEPEQMQALVGAEEIKEQRLAGGGRKKVRQRTFTILCDPDSPYGGRATVPLSATVEYGGNEYAVTEIVGQTASQIQFAAVHTRVIDKTRPGYRG